MLERGHRLVRGRATNCPAVGGACAGDHVEDGGGLGGDAPRTASQMIDQPVRVDLADRPAVARCRAGDGLQHRHTRPWTALGRGRRGRLHQCPTPTGEALDSCSDLIRCGSEHRRGCHRGRAGGALHHRVTVRTGASCRDHEDRSRDGGHDHEDHYRTDSPCAKAAAPARRRQPVLESGGSWVRCRLPKEASEPGAALLVELVVGHRLITSRRATRARCKWLRAVPGRQPMISADSSSE